VLRTTPPSGFAAVPALKSIGDKIAQADAAQASVNRVDGQSGRDPNRAAHAKADVFEPLTFQQMLDRGGRQDIFLGTRDCQGYVEPCEFGSDPGELDGAGELGFGLMFHGFDYPDETGDHKLHARFWTPRLRDGVLQFPRPEECTIRKFVREMSPKRFGLGVNVKPAAADAKADFVHIGDDAADGRSETRGGCTRDQDGSEEIRQGAASKSARRWGNGHDSSFVPLGT